MFDINERQTILNLAFDSIRYGLEYGEAIDTHKIAVSDALHLQGACFVTLEINGQLRGCIGSLQAHRTLVEDIAENAFAAAFKDPRFKPLTNEEFDFLEVHVSVLNEPEEASFISEDDLMQQLRPGVDGLIIQDGAQRATFLPSVWESLPDKRQFMNHLKVKAGLSKDYWSDTMRAYTYQVEIIGGENEFHDFDQHFDEDEPCEPFGAKCNGSGAHNHSGYDGSYQGNDDGNHNRDLDNTCGSDNDSSLEHTGHMKTQNNVEHADKVHTGSSIENHNIITDARTVNKYIVKKK